MTLTNMNETVVLPKTTINLAEICISQETFKKLPRELQLEYAKHYMVLDPEVLTSDQICAALYTGNEGIRALDSHVQYPTPTGLIVAKNAMDLVDWIVANRTEQIEDAHGESTTNNLSAPEDTFGRTLASEECDQSHLADDKHEMERRPRIRQTKTDENRNHSFGYPDWLCRTVNELAGPHDRVTPQILGLLMRLVIGLAGVEIGNLVEDIARSIRRAYLQKAGVMTPDSHPATRISPKRVREDEDEDQEGRESRDITHRRKRARREDSEDSGTSSGDDIITNQVQWKDYPSDEGDNSDSSYSPSSGTDDDVMTSEDAWHARQFHRVVTDDRGYISGNLSSEEETQEVENSENDDVAREIYWKDYPSEDDESSDCDYSPPNWTFEDILDMAGSRSIFRYDKVDYRYMDELIERGPISDDGLSDSSNDSLERYHDISTLRGSLLLSDRLGHLNRRPQHLHIRAGVGGKWVLEDIRKKPGWFRDHAYALSTKGNQRRKEPGWEICDIDARLEVVLADDQLEYEFDEHQWKGFEDPVIRRSTVTE